MFTMAPARRDHIPAFRTAAGVAIPLLLLLWIGRFDLAIYANFGAFTGVYGRHETRQDRARHQLLAGTAIVVAIAIGATMSWTHTNQWLIMLISAVASSVWATIALWSGTRPTGSVFVLFAIAAVGSLAHPAHPLIATAVAAATAGLCFGLGRISHLIGEGPNVREPRGEEVGVDKQALKREAARFFLAPLLAGTIGIISVALIDPLSHFYWAMVAAVVPLVNNRYRVQYFRALQRMLGTLSGILVAGFLLSHHMQEWQVVIWIIILQFLTETYVTRNYTLAASFITPTALLMIQAVEPAPVAPMLLARSAETILGAASALVIIAIGYTKTNPHLVRQRFNVAAPKSQAPKARTDTLTQTAADTAPHTPHLQP